MNFFKFLGVIILALISVENSFSQAKKALEVKFGSGETKIAYDGNFPDLVSGTSEHVFLSLGALRYFGNGLSYGVEGEYYRFDTFISYTPLELRKKKGGTRSDFFAFGPKVQKDIPIWTNFGLSLATAFHLTFNTSGNYQFQGGELQAVRLPGGEPAIPVRLYGERTVETVTFLLKPEIGVFFDLTEKSRITLSGKYGWNLKDRSIVTDLDRIEIEEDTFHNTYIYNGNFTSVLLGYRYSF